MPRFSVAFGRRKSTADELQNAEVAPEPSFRVLERVDVTSGKSFDGGARLARATTTATVFAQPNLLQTPDEAEDNMFAGLKVNRYVAPFFPLFCSALLSGLAVPSIPTNVMRCGANSPYECLVH